MKKVKFAYNEPRFGDFEATEDMSEEDIMQAIEESYPEAIDIEITEYEEVSD